MTVQVISDAGHKLLPLFATLMQFSHYRVDNASAKEAVQLQFQGIAGEVPVRGIQTQILE
jgi:hypothetical protein